VATLPMPLLLAALAAGAPARSSSSANPQ